jgi:hypothetical protein
VPSSRFLDSNRNPKLWFRNILLLENQCQAPDFWKVTEIQSYSSGIFFIGESVSNSRFLESNRNPKVMVQEYSFIEVQNTPYVGGTKDILKGWKSGLFVQFCQFPCSWIQESKINADPNPKHCILGIFLRYGT